MVLNCNPELAAHLHGRTQKVRVITESWFGGFGYCLHCTSDRLEQTAANTRARDYECPRCGTPYELKSSAKALGARVVDGEYATMMRRIAAGEAPTLMLLQYTPDWCIQNLVALHSVFLTPAVVEARKPLSMTARRAGWQGCNLRVDRIPVDGRIALVRDGELTDKHEVRRLFAKSEQLAELKPEQRGWVGLVLAAVRKIGKTHVTNADLYLHEEAMHAAYPQNSHVRPKIRQQMQELERLGYVLRVANGEYEVLR